MPQAATCVVQSGSAGRHSQNRAVFHLVTELKNCARLKDLDRGRAAHAGASKKHLESNVYVASALVRMYSRCGRMLEAKMVFDGAQCRDVVSWTSLMLGYAENGEGTLALELFTSMCLEFVPDDLAFVAAFKACNTAALQEGRRGEAVLAKGMALHQMCFEKTSNLHGYVSSSLLNLYTRCGCVDEARRVFNTMEQPDLVCWNTLLLGYAEHGEGAVALELFCTMQSQSCLVHDAVTLLSCLKACTALAANEVGQEVDGQLVKVASLQKGAALHAQAAPSKDTNVANTLVGMYADCGCLLSAGRVFGKVQQPDVVSWTVLILGHAENGQPRSALYLFNCMLCEGCPENPLTFVAVVKACTSMAEKTAFALRAGKHVHSLAASLGYDKHLLVSNSLVRMYTACGSLKDADQVFGKMQNRDVTLWDTLILGHAENGDCWVSLELYSQMKDGGYTPGPLTMAAVLKACGKLGALETGKEVHADICRLRLDKETLVANSLVDFYSKCGSMVHAQQVFDSFVSKDLISWTSLMLGYSRQGVTDRVFSLFEDMRNAGLRPDKVIFLCIMTACSYVGCIDKAMEYFDLMVSKYGITPELEHFSCIANILGNLDETEAALAMIKIMPFKADNVAWTSLLGSCRSLKHVDVAREAFESWLSQQGGQRDAAPYVLVANSLNS